MGTNEQLLAQIKETKVSQRIANRVIKDILQDFDNKEIIIPPYQRSFIWDTKTRSRFIESLFMNIPIPAIFLLEKPDDKGCIKFEVIDGSQRLNTLQSFRKGEFRLTGLLKLTDLNRTKYSDLQPFIQNTLLSRQLQTIIIEKTTNQDIQFEIFERLNQGSISLNAQELRNCMFHGKFNDFLLELRCDNLYKELLKPFKKFQQVSASKPDRNRLLDVEMILRFFALYENYQIHEAKKFISPTKDMLNCYMKMKTDEDKNYSMSNEKLKSVFLKILKMVEITFQGNQFRSFKVKDSKAQFETFNKSVFDVQLLGFVDIEISDIQNKTKLIYEKFLDISSYNSKFISYISASTDQKINERISIWQKALKEILSKTNEEYLKQIKLKEDEFSNKPCCKLCNQPIKKIEEADFKDQQLVHRYCYIQKNPILSNF